MFDFPFRIRFFKDHHSDNHWIYLVIQYQIINIALMVREKTNKTSKTLSVACAQQGRASCLTLLLEKHFFARIDVLTNTDISDDYPESRNLVILVAR